MTLSPSEPSHQWTRSQVSLNLRENFEFSQLFLLDLEQKNYSQVTFQVPDLEENKTLPIKKSDNMVTKCSTENLVNFNILAHPFCCLFLYVRF